MSSFDCVVHDDIFQVGLIYPRILITDDLSILGIIAHPLAVDAFTSSQWAGAREAEYQMMAGLVELLIKCFDAAIRSFQLSIFVLA